MWRVIDAGDARMWRLCEEERVVLVAERLWADVFDEGMEIARRRSGSRRLLSWCFVAYRESVEYHELHSPHLARK